MHTLASIIEGILWFKGQPVEIADLARITKKTQSEIETALAELKTTLDGHGITLVMNDHEAELCTHTELGTLLSQLQKEEMEKPLSRASLETLAIIAYNDGIMRSEIDYIRGVNSTFILRALEMRGLVEKKINPDDKRSMVYYPTLEFLKSLGVPHASAFPQYQELKDKLTALKQTSEHEVLE